MQRLENEIAWPALFILGPDRRVLFRDVSDTHAEQPTVDVLLGALDAAH